MNARKVRVLVYIIEYAFAWYNNCTISSFISKILFENLLNADQAKNLAAIARGGKENWILSHLYG